VTPKPSQPSSSLIRLGLIISKNMEKTNRNTIPMNRPKNLSLDMYDVLYSITAPEIRHTVLKKNKDM